MPIAVVKLGGSLANAGTLGGWLDAVLAHGRGRTVVVPGGGAFADAVRSAQVRLGFSDRAAARMAVLAMEQYAELLLDRAPSLRACSDAAAIRAALAASDVALWRPSRMVESDPAIAASWDVTSDSLAAWLARRVEAHRLVLVKSADVPPPPVTAAELAALGLVDPEFPAYAEAAGCALFCCGPGEHGRLAGAVGLG